MKRLEVKSFGPLLHADITFGDLTVLVGPQATGKSLFVQLVKAIRDAAAIRSELKSHGFDWLRGRTPVADYCSLYFGGGLHDVVTSRTSIRRDGALVDFAKRVVKSPGNASPDETVFLVPAQRVLVLQRGWPQPFMSYSVGDPYAMRHFSDRLRLLMEGFGAEGTIFPHAKRLKASLKSSLNRSIYIDAKLELETEGLQKRLVLTRSGGGSLPYLAWSAGQREFTPLLLGLYWLLPPAKLARRGALETVIIEEPEMGLHPQAIVSFCLMALELLERNYRVILSTHSPVVLDVVWALRELRAIPRRAALRALSSIFGAQRTPQLAQIFAAALEREYRTYYFARTRTEDGVETHDISSLDPGADEESTAGWGGLSGFSGRIAEIVGDALARGSL